MRHLVFVYGTLKAGGSLHHLLEEQRRSGAATIFGFSLYDLGRFPALRADGGNTPVHGEVFYVDDACLKRLDHIEGVHLKTFARITRPVKMEASGNLVEAQVYVFIESLPKSYSVGGQAREVKKIEDGIWTEPKFLYDY
jgi:gamma-glutamylcyclotransferase (GGCT)/AIG2-like uncharacterized protein YtfP